MVTFSIRVCLWLYLQLRLVLGLIIQQLSIYHLIISNDTILIVQTLVTCISSTGLIKELCLPACINALLHIALGNDVVRNDGIYVKT